MAHLKNCPSLRRIDTYYLMQILEDTQLTKQQNFGRPQL